MTVIGRYALFTCTFLTYKAACLGLCLRGGGGIDTENEHHITEFFKPVDRESEGYKQVQARNDDVGVEDVGVEDGPVVDAEDDKLLSMLALDSGDVELEQAQFYED